VSGSHPHPTPPPTLNNHQQRPCPASHPPVDKRNACAPLFNPLLLLLSSPPSSSRPPLPPPLPGSRHSAPVRIPPRADKAFSLCEWGWEMRGS
ncbi:Titin like, partial [Dissostichus eleginoides]